jgi:hypothetical protein
MYLLYIERLFEILSLYKEVWTSVYGYMGEHQIKLTGMLGIGQGSIFCILPHTTSYYSFSPSYVCLGPQYRNNRIL